jgi:hypothetical protein
MTNLFLKAKVDHFCEKYGIRNYKINDEGLVDVGSRVFLNANDLEEIPIPFGTVDVGFSISDNKISSLKNCPIRVNGTFSCSHNPLSDLSDGPQYVSDNYFCMGITDLSLKYLPKKVGKNFECGSLKDAYEARYLLFTEFEDLDIKVEGFDREQNDHLRTLIVSFWALNHGGKKEHIFNVLSRLKNWPKENQ